MTTSLQANQSFGAKLLHFLTLGTRDVYKTGNGQLITMKADQGKVETDDNGEVNIFDAKNVRAKGVNGVTDEFYLHNCTGSNNRGKNLNDEGDIFKQVEDGDETSATSASSSSSGTSATDAADSTDSTSSDAADSASDSDLKQLLNQLLQLLQGLNGDNSATASDSESGSDGVFDTTVNGNDGTVNIDNNYNSPKASDSADETSDSDATSAQSSDKASNSTPDEVTVNNEAGDGDEITNNAHEKEYDGSEDRKLEKKPIESSSGNGSGSASGAGNIFNTTVNGNNGTVNINNNYNSDGKGAQSATKQAVSKDFISGESTKDGVTTYTLSNGMKVDVPEGTEIGDDSFYIDPDSGETSFSGLSGATITGTKKDDAITLYDCEDTEVDAGKGDDNIQAYNSKDITLNGGKGDDTIKTVSCDGITNKGGKGDDTITNVNCTGTVNNDGGDGKDKVQNDVYDILNKTAVKNDDSSKTSGASSKDSTGTMKEFLEKFMEFLKQYMDK